MSVLYTVIPVDNSLLIDQKVIEWLGDWKIELPETFVPGWFPTLRELKAVLENLKDCTIEYRMISTYHIYVSSPTDRVEISILGFPGWLGDTPTCCSETL